MREGRPQEIQIAARSDVGLRRSENQDCYGSWCTSGGRQLLVVADGMGGHQGGATASRMVIAEIGAVFCAAPPDEPAAELLLRAFGAANRAIHAEAESELSLRGMGSTGVALLFEGGGEPWRGWAAHAGDSRLYRWREGQLEQLTRDHSLGAALREQKGMSEAEVAALPEASSLLRALGPFREVEVDVQPVSIAAGDVFVLCSDGLTGMVGDAGIGSVLARHGPREAARLLVEAANRSGGVDNITVQIAALPAAGAAVRDEVPAGPAPAARGARRWARRAALLGLLPLGLLLALGAARLHGRSGAAARGPLAATARAERPPRVLVDELPADVAAAPRRARATPALLGQAESSHPDQRSGVSAVASPERPAVLEALRAQLAAYQRGFRSCDFDALERAADRLALVWAHKRCQAGAPSELVLTLEPGSLQSQGAGRYRVDVIEREGERENRLAASVERRADGSWRITDLPLGGSGNPAAR